MPFVWKTAFKGTPLVIISTLQSNIVKAMIYLIGEKYPSLGCTIADEHHSKSPEKPYFKQLPYEEFEKVYFQLKMLYIRFSANQFVSWIEKILILGKTHSKTNTLKKWM